MLSLFHPWALAGLLLLAVPILIHLFKPRKTRRTPFPNLRWLRESQHKFTRRIQWHQLLLFLFRAAIVVFLVLMLARPLLRLGEKENAVERFIILDRSRSMGYAVAEGPTPFEEGRRIVERLLAASGPDDRNAVILASGRREVLSPLSSDSQPALTALKVATPLREEADLGGTLPMIRSLLRERRPGTPVEIVFITTNLQAAWSQSAIAAFLQSDVAKEGELRVRVLDVAPAPMTNAWIAEARLEEAKGRQPLRIEFNAGWSGSGEVEKTVYLTGLRDLPETSLRAVLKGGELTRLAIELPANTDYRGQIARLSLQPGDALPDDDTLDLSLHPRGGEKILVIESAVTQVRLLQPGLHLRVALQALAQMRSLEYEITPPDQVTPEQIAAAGMILWIEPDALPEATLTALENRVRAGAGLALFLGPGVNVSFFNSRLHREGGEALSPVRLNRIVEDQPHETGGGFTAIDWRHPLLARLFDPTYNDLPQTRVRGYFTLGEPAAGTQVIATLRGTTPGLLEHPYGAGNVLVANFTANDLWSDLPRRPGFLPLLDRMVTHLTGGFGRHDFRIGEPVILALGPRERAPEVTVTTPSGETLRPGVRQAGGQYLMELEPPPAPGIYRVNLAGEEGSRAFIVQTSRTDSNLARMNPEVLAQWWAPAVFESAAATDADAGIARERYPLWPWFALLAGLAFLGEMILVHSLCPRLNPGQAQSRIPQNGLLSRPETLS